MRRWLRRLGRKLAVDGFNNASSAQTSGEGNMSGLPSPPGPPSVDSTAVAVCPKAGGSTLEAPVTFENFSREFASMSQQDSFQGFRLEASKPLLRYLQVSQSLALGMSSSGQQNCSYHIGPTVSTEDRRTMLMGRLDLNGTITARAVHRATDTVELKGSLSSSRKDESMFEAGVDKIGPTWTTSTRAIWQGAWIMNGAFSQAVTPRLQMGGDLTWVAANNATMTSFGARYCQGKNILSCLVSRQPDFGQHKPFPSCGEAHTAKIDLFHKVSDRLSLGTEFEYSHPSQDSALKVAADYLFRTARVQALVDSGGRLSVFAQDASGVGVSGSADVWRDDYRVGLIMQMMPPGDE
eukprot:Polyplicarium_translucidae@DN549_c0_g1_i1.p2